jgi:UDP-GlcNAc3NAcA epimerase
MFKVLTVVGARPQFVKAAMVSGAIVQHNEAASAGERIEEIILHTGQHYDENMSRVFFDEMGIAEPAVNLNVGSGLHGETTAAMLAGIEREIIEHKPDVVLTYGDTNSTVAASLAAAKLHVPVAHVEAGLRSYNRRMPEEINRIVTDHLSTLLFCPTSTAVRNLQTEGITSGVHLIGDVMYDAAMFFGRIAEEKSDVLARYGLDKKSYSLATVHRAENTDDKQRLSAIMTALVQCADEGFPIVLPLHPRTRHALLSNGLVEEEGKHLTLVESSHVKIIPPVSFLDMVMLEKHAGIILTDSGGVQKEAYFHGAPCITLRDETEWVELVDAGANTLVGANVDAIITAFSDAKTKTIKTTDLYGKGHSAGRIVNCLLNIE